MNLLPDLSWNVCAQQATVGDGRGLILTADRVDQSFEGFDVLVVPGGYGTRVLEDDPKFLNWFRTASDVPLKISVCTGSLLLGAAGWLKGKEATTHPSSVAELSKYGARYVDNRIVDSGDVVTAGGVSAAIDLGLYMVERLAGAQARSTISRQMDYPYYPAQVSQL